MHLETGGVSKPSIQLPAYASDASDALASDVDHLFLAGFFKMDLLKTAEETFKK